MKKTYCGFIIFIMSVQLASAGWTPYVSPGLRMGYVFGHGLSFSTKISLGLAFGEKDDFNNYVNITFGVKEIRSGKQAITWPKLYKYTEVQFGTLQKELKGYVGGSLGYYNPTNDQPVAGTRWSACYGVFGFGSLEVESFGKDVTLYDLGAVGVLPIPLILLFWNGSM